MAIDSIAPIDYIPVFPRDFPKLWPYITYIFPKDFPYDTTNLRSESFVNRPNDPGRWWPLAARVGPVPRSRWEGQRTAVPWKVCGNYDDPWDFHGFPHGTKMHDPWEICIYIYIRSDLYIGWDIYIYIYKRYIWDIWEIYGTYMGHIWEIYDDYMMI